MRRIWFFALLVALSAGCGGSEKKVDKEGIRERADDADRDLDEESEKQGDES